MVDMRAALVEAIVPADLPAILALNNLHAREVSELGMDKLERLVAGAFVATRIGRADAFMIGFDQAADYDSPNFLWFRARHARFAYVDRIAVSETARGRGYGRLLYEDFFARAVAAGHTLVCCEVNLDPPNPQSDAFHAALGFKPVGSASLYGGERSVRYFERDL